MRPDFQRDPAARHGAEDFLQRFAVVRTRCSSCIRPVSSSTQYQLLRSPRSSPMVSCCCEIFLLCFVAAVLTFFIAGLLFICALSTSITWERTPHPVRRPAFSSHLITSTIPESSYVRGVLRRSIRGGVCVHVSHHAHTIPLNRRGIPNLLLQMLR